MALEPVMCQLYIQQVRSDSHASTKSFTAFCITFEVNHMELCLTCVFHDNLHSIMVSL